MQLREQGLQECISLLFFALLFEEGNVELLVVLPC